MKGKFKSHLPLKNSIRDMEESTHKIKDLMLLSLESMTQCY